MSRSVLKWSGGVVEFDAVEIEEMSHDAAITSYPVEYGVDLVDHIRVEPVTVRLTVYVSNNPTRDNITQQMDGIVPTLGLDVRVKTPIIPKANLLKAPTSFAGMPLLYDSTVRAQVRVWGSIGNPVRRVTNVYAELRNGMAEARLYTLASDLGDYDNMVIRSLSINRDVHSANAPRFNLDLQQVTFAVLSERDLTKAKPKKARSKPSKDEGRKQATAADQQTEKQIKDGLVAQWIYGD